MITISQDGKMCVGWIQNGIHNKRCFRSDKEAYRFQELVEDIQNCMKLAEEMERFNRDFKYDPKIVELKNTELSKEIQELKEKIRIKEALQKKLGVAAQKLSEQPRNVIDRETFLKEIKQLKLEINRLDRFFKEHAIVALNTSLHEAIKEMKDYFQYQKQSISHVEAIFKDVKKEIVGKFGSITTKDKILSAKEAAKYLGIGYHKLNELMFTQKLPFIKIGHRRKIKERDLEAWVAAHEEKIHSR